MTMWQDLWAEQNQDITFHFDLTLDDEPFNYTGFTLSLVLKPSQTSPDSAGVTFGVSSGLTVVNQVLGKLDWALPHAYTGTPGTQWWRLDAVDNSSFRTPLMMGNLTVQAV